MCVTVPGSVWLHTGSRELCGCLLERQGIWQALTESGCVAPVLSSLATGAALVWMR